MGLECGEANNKYGEDNEGMVRMRKKWVEIEIMTIIMILIKLIV